MLNIISLSLKGREQNQGTENIAMYIPEPKVKELGRGKRLLVSHCYINMCI